MITPRVDWFRVFVELDRAGYSLRMVAATLSMPYDTLLSRRNYGVEPRHQDGEAIVGLWCSVLCRPVADIPRMQAEPLSAARSKREY